MKRYNFSKIEQKWQKKWTSGKAFEAKDSVKGKKKFYVLDMFPYPSGEGLHMGHAFVYSIGDIYARFKRMAGFNVLYPIGYDSLGLPAENAAIKARTHPRDYTKKSMANFMAQQKAMGWSYDWNRLVVTGNPEFYKWDQWIFLKMLERGIAYRKKAPVNWCKKCDTVLANEQVINGKCWRHEDTAVITKHLEQWFFKITNYADELLRDLDKLDWSDRAKKLQRNWIGKSHGVEIHFEVDGERWPVFTTRPDTLFGVTFMVVSAQHHNLFDLVTEKQVKEVKTFLKKIKTISKKNMGDLEKEGAFTGSYAINPLTEERIPIYTGNFVVADYGSGMVMAVPAHDQRDFEFAKKYQIPIKQVIKTSGKAFNIKKQAYTGDGLLVNSYKFDGLESREAKGKIIEELGIKKLGKKKIQYKLRDWLISRQRYWGAPIPVIYCKECGIVPVKEKDLPIKLPEKVKFGKGNPLTTSKSFLNVKCPSCKGKARRETDTMDTFANSSWYFLRYTDPKNKSKIFNSKKANYWAPIDQYIGGPEHITAHLIYIRFYTKFLRDLGLLEFDEPASKYFTQGIVHGADGEKMSKSRGNIVEPWSIIKKYGADALRLFLVSVASPENDFNWNDKGIEGSFKFTQRAMDYFSSVKIVSEADPKIESKLNLTIKQVTEYIENFKYNLAVIRIRELFNSFPEETSKDVLEKSLKLLSPFCPHIAEELWQKIGNKGFISLSEWPVLEGKKINMEFEKEDGAISKLTSDVAHIISLMGKNKKPVKVFIYPLPHEKQIYEHNKESISEKVCLDVEVFAVNDIDKYDPEHKAKKAKPGKPGIYLE